MCLHAEHREKKFFNFYINNMWLSIVAIVAIVVELLDFRENKYSVMKLKCDGEGEEGGLVFRPHKQQIKCFLGSL